MTYETIPSTSAGGRVDARMAPLHLAKIDRVVLERVRNKLEHGMTYAGGKKNLWFRDGVSNDRVLSGEEAFCRMWGAGITLNMKRPVTRLGSLTFSGVVLARKQIR